MSSTNVPSRFALGAMTFRGRRFEDAVAAAAASGFDGIGVSVGQVVSALERGMSVEEMADRVSSHGLRVAELELVRIGDPRVRHLNELVLDLIPVLTPDRIHVAAFHGQPEQVAADLAEVCTRARDTTVAFEFMPYSAIRNVADMQSPCCRPPAANTYRSCSTSSISSAPAGSSTNSPRTCVHRWRSSSSPTSSPAGLGSTSPTRLDTSGPTPATAPSTSTRSSAPSPRRGSGRPSQSNRSRTRSNNSRSAGSPRAPAWSRRACSPTQVGSPDRVTHPEEATCLHQP
jgi:hypothetical protein